MRVKLVPPGATFEPLRPAHRAFIAAMASLCIHSCSLARVVSGHTPSYPSHGTLCLHMAAHWHSIPLKARRATPAQPSTICGSPHLATSTQRAQTTASPFKRWLIYSSSKMSVLRSTSAPGSGGKHSATSQPGSQHLRVLDADAATRHMIRATTATATT